MMHACMEKSELTKVKARAMRCGVWFRLLTRAERAQMDLTIRIVKKIRSSALAKVVTSIVKKLLDAMECKIARVMRETGRALARKLSRIAQKWGNKSSVSWEADPGFVRYLAISCMNEPALFRLP